MDRQRKTVTAKRKETQDRSPPCDYPSYRLEAVSRLKGRKRETQTEGSSPIQMRRWTLDFREAKAMESLGQSTGNEENAQRELWSCADRPLEIFG